MNKPRKEIQRLSPEREIEFADLYTQHYPQILRLVKKRINGNDLLDAENLTQKAFLKAYGAFEKFREEAKFSTWMIQIAFNVCNDATRHKKQFISIEGAAEEGNPIQLQDSAGDPYQQLITECNHWELKRQLAHLPTRARRIITLKHIEGLSHAEIASVMGTTEENAKNTNFRALRQLRNNFKEERQLGT